MQIIFVIGVKFQAVKLNGIVDNNLIRLVYFMSIILDSLRYCDTSNTYHIMLTGYMSALIVPYCSSMMIYMYM